MLQTKAVFVHHPKRRWYRIDAGQDLFGDSMMVCRWGALDSRAGNELTTPISAASLESAVALAVKKRIGRGYVLVQD